MADHTYEIERAEKYGAILDVVREGKCNRCGNRTSMGTCTRFTLVNPKMCGGQVVGPYRYTHTVSVVNNGYPGSWFPAYQEQLDTLHTKAKETRERQSLTIKGWWYKRREELRAQRKAGV